jgi:predicted RNA-binding Zn-ribbon protein involved in translation (DUF1610 family)
VTLKSEKSDFAGTPLKLGPSFESPRPFPHILGKDSMIPGETYLGWECKSCRHPMAVETTAPLAARIPEAHLVEVKCRHCGETQIRTWAARTKADGSYR